MTEHTSLSSDLDLLSKDPLTEKNINDFSMFDTTLAESPIPQQPLIQTLLEGTITPPNRPNTFIFNGSIRKKKTENLLEHALEKQKSEEAAQKYSKTRIPRFHYNLNYTLRKGVNQ